MTPTLQELQRISTSGARAVESFEVGGLRLLAIPQLARDVAGGPRGMNAGDSNTDMLLLRRVGGDRFAAFSSLPVPGGEDAEHFTIGDRTFLAVASIRTGSDPYEYTVDSCIYEWTDDHFVEFQKVLTHAAKQWRYWAIGDRHFLGLAQGLVLPHVDGPNRPSIVFEWDGSSFVEFQVIESQWAYNWHPFSIGPQHLVAHADHTGPSVLYRWDGSRYVAHQDLLPRAGRAFAHFTTDDGEHYLVVAGLEQPPQVLRWRDARFEAIQTLHGVGARELAVVRWADRIFVIRVNFIQGTPSDPHPELTSQVYEWSGAELRTVAEFPTSGGTDVQVLDVDEVGVRFVVSNSLSPKVEFATDTIVYSFVPDHTAAERAS